MRFAWVEIKKIAGYLTFPVNCDTFTSTLHVCRGTHALGRGLTRPRVEKVEPDPLNLLVNTSVGSKLRTFNSEYSDNRRFPAWKALFFAMRRKI